MQNFSFKLPVDVFQTKKSKVLFSLNKVIGINPFAWNKLKKNYSEIVIDSLPKDVPQFKNKFKTILTYNYKNKNSDLDNITPVITKIVLDVFQELDIIKNDNIQFHIENINVVGEKVDSPYIYFTILEVNEDFKKDPDEYKNFL